MSTCISPPLGQAPAGLTRQHRRTLRQAAFRDVAAVAPGVVPFGITLGIAANSYGTGTLATLGGAAAVYGGSAQLTTMTVLHLGSGLVAAVVAGAVANARLMLYGAALAPRFAGGPRWFRLLGPQFLLDQTYLAAHSRPELAPAEFRRYWGWLGWTLLFVWVAAVLLGLLADPLLPPLPHLGLVGAALFVAMLVPKLTDRPSVVAALVGGAVAVGTSRIVPELGILTGTLTGVLAATLADRRTS